MSQVLLLLGASSIDDSQLFEVALPNGDATELALDGYPLDGAAITGLTTFDGKLYFSGGSQGSAQLWALAGPSDTATQVTPPSAVPELDARNLIAFGGKLFFSGRDASGNVDLYASDGTAAGTTTLSVAGASPSGLVPDDIVAYRGRLYFSGLDTTGVSRLWVSDGTAGGTAVLPVFDIDSTNISLAGVGLNPTNITVANNRLLFAGTDLNGQTSLWVSDGTSGGTSELAVTGAAPTGVNPTTSNMVAFNGLTYFAGADASGQIGLWSTDGTANGTMELAIANAGANGVNPVSLTVFGGSFYFGGIDGNGQTGLWKSDGTAAGTSELGIPGADPSGLSPMALDASDHPNVAMSVFDGSLYFSGLNAAGAYSLWRSDGTASGTVQVSVPNASGGVLGLLPSDFTVADLAAGTVNPVPDVVGPAISSASLGTVPFSTYMPLVVGTGPASITMDVAEEAFQGDAQYTVSVDGVQVGGVLTSSANYTAGQSQSVTVQGSWLTGVHTLSVDFLNDGYGGTIATNRNLYVSLAHPLDAVGVSSMFLGYQGSQQIYVQAEPTTSIDSANIPPAGSPITTPSTTDTAQSGDMSGMAGTTTTTSGLAIISGINTLSTLLSAGMKGTTSTSTMGTFQSGTDSSGDTDAIPVVSGSVGTPGITTSTILSGSETQIITLAGGTSIPTTGSSPSGTIFGPPTATAASVSGSAGLSGTSTSDPSSADGGHSSSVSATGTASLAGLDSVTSVHGVSNYVVLQTSSATTYLTPMFGVSLTTASSLANVVYSQGSDTIAAQGASDLVFASGPAATVSGGSGTLIFVSGLGSYTAGGGTGTDVLYGGPGTAVLTGASGPGNILVAGTGNASLAGGSGSGALMFGGSGTTSFVGSSGGADTMVGGTGTNTFDLTNGDIAFGGPDEPDTFHAGTGNSLIVEGGGATLVSLESGSLTAFSGSGTGTYTVTKGLSSQATIVGFKAGDRISLTGGFTALDATNALRGASTGSFGTALSLADGTKIVLSGVTLGASQLVVS